MHLLVLLFVKKMHGGNSVKFEKLKEMLYIITAVI
jgi:hypothetical protein